eukprot:scaffold86380_cov51-Phaeocystis_antarctica.AAC.1
MLGRPRARHREQRSLAATDALAALAATAALAALAPLGPPPLCLPLGLPQAAQLRQIEGRSQAAQLLSTSP